MAQFEVTHEMQAPKGLRFVHLLIDYFAFFAFLFIVIFALGIVFTALGNDAFIRWTVSGSVSVNLASIGFYLVYYFLFETFTARTLAKFITGTIVIDEFGEKPSARTVLIRTLCRLIPFEHFSFLGDRGWHDSISKTYVVKKHIYLMRKNEVIELDEIGKNSELL